ncbi:DUF3267 domain-containing protein [Gracilibacillus ureilyticus]|uniref:DUF3267 domain-containing protein n=1 Tax=Gracilibacillus ureilyticus TaxID=531814 RepID=UPI001FE1D8F5|nr:DUF3267 domain-containing protein [Gracilibacillus ureilyticus]
MKKKLGITRLIILSFIFGLLSFITLYLPFTFIHPEAAIQDNGFLPIIAGLALLPLLHKTLHVIPLKCADTGLKLSWSFVLNLIPNFKVCSNTKTSKPILLFALLSPTLFITIPCIIAGYMYSGYYPYFLLFGAVNLSLSYVDFIYVRHVWKAPKKCIISNDDQGYDILIQR